MTMNGPWRLAERNANICSAAACLPHAPKLQALLGGESFPDPFIPVTPQHVQVHVALTG